MRKRLTRKQRREKLVTERARLMMQLMDSDAAQHVLEQAPQWNLAKTLEALRYLESADSLPYGFVKQPLHLRDLDAGVMAELIAKYESDMVAHLTRGR
jgi:hypothetical protein